MKHSTHKIDPFVLPARFWKWRLRCAGLYFAEELEDHPELRSGDRQRFNEPG